MVYDPSIYTLLGSIDFIESLRGKHPTFLLSLSTTKTCYIEGITQAGLPGKTDLTPTLDSEFLCLGQMRSLPVLATTPKGIPSPALITRAVELLHPFRDIALLDLGLMYQPKLDYFDIHTFGLTPSGAIDQGANMNAMDIFQKGVDFGKHYKSQGDYIILAESVPAGTTTAQAVAMALGYECEGMFSSSFKTKPDGIKQRVINQALSHIDHSSDLFSQLSAVGDNMLVFNAGFILGALTHEKPIILAGGTQMAAVLLVVNTILRVMQGEFEARNIALCTTKWVAQDETSDLKGLLELLDFPVHAYYANFDFSLSEYDALRAYDKGEAKEGVGAGAALCYGLLNGLSHKKITQQVEYLLESLIGTSKNRHYS